MSNDRYEKIRAALAGMDAAAAARNEHAWRDAHTMFMVHVAPGTIHALLEERDALVAENARLRKLLLDERDALAAEVERLARLACGAECAAAITELAVRWNVPFERL